MQGLLKSYGFSFKFFDHKQIGVRKHVFFSSFVWNKMNRDKIKTDDVLHDLWTDPLNIVRGKWTNLIGDENVNFIHEIGLKFNL